ncbi:related to heterokaryon incompatibility protein [Phialocephala subalpina]|uniref:Related to heterokaryon incompatibility protein n=1 Tax=Phialocephala subalpina TaxID=576137 RepID=A0A1L7WN34_9HELO|nr:related to heterokaryon incompatibility protein [Phialocephala subalpina]
MFVYQPLDVETPTIRLLKNIRRDEDGLISMSIEHVALKSHPRYAALSWVWGKESSFSEIRLNGGTFHLSNRLYYILEWICKNPQISSYWWIDSICLNQTDLEEKISQVNLMERIYREAEKTIGWFGKGSEGITLESQLDTTTSQGEEAIRFLHAIKDERDQLEDRKYREDFLLKHSDPAPWRAVEKFFLRPWWIRVWTLQEFVIPQEFIFCCGKESIGRADMNSATYCVNLFQGMSAFPVKNEAVLPAWNRRRLYNWQRIAGSTFESGLETRPSELPLPALIAYSSDSKATIAEDRIYSLLGLAQHKLVRPEYKLGIRNSYTEFVRAFITINKSLDIICFAHIFNQSERVSKLDPILPSWVPDWRVHRESWIMPIIASQSGVSHIGNFRPAAERKLRPDKTIFAAGGDHPPRVRFSANLMTLTCGGILVDRIDGIGGIKIERRAWEENRDDFSIPTGLQCVQSTSPANTGPRLEISDAVEDNRSHYRHVFSIIEDIARCLVLDRKDRYLTYQAPSQFCAAFARSCKIAHETPQILPPRSKLWFELNKNLLIRGHPFENLCSAVSRFSTSAGDQETQLLDLAGNEVFWSRVNDTVINMERRLVTTEGGSIGMAPYRVRKGDMVSVLVGCNIPVILRQRGSGYEVIGECYLHGFMNGEAFKLVDVDKSKLEDFNLV